MLGSTLKPSLELEKLTRRYGGARARALLAEAREAYDFLGRFIAEENIACNYAETGGFTGILKPAHYDALARKTAQLTRTVGLEVHMVTKSQLRSEVGTDLYCGGRVLLRRAVLETGTVPCRLGPARPGRGCYRCRQERCRSYSAGSP